MWIMVMFDLPVTKKKERKAASKFRKFLLDEGFNMSQFSVYMRFCGKRDRLNRYLAKINANVPPNGKVSVMFFTDKQYGNIINYSNRKRTKLPLKSAQYVLFGIDEEETDE